MAISPTARVKTMFTLHMVTGNAIFVSDARHVQAWLERSDITFEDFSDPTKEHRGHEDRPCIVEMPLALAVAKNLSIDPLRPMPIATAPRDGRELYLISIQPQDGGAWKIVSIHNGFWSDKPARLGGGVQGFMLGQPGFDSGVGDGCATHWLPAGVLILPFVPFVDTMRLALPDTPPTPPEKEVRVYAALMIDGVERSPRKERTLTIERLERDETNPRMHLDRPMMFDVPADCLAHVRFFDGPTGPEWSYEFGADKLIFSPNDLKDLRRIGA